MNSATIPLKHLVRINPETLGDDTSPDLEFRYIDISAVGRGHLDSAPVAMTFAEAPSRARRVLARGDTIISTVRTYLRAVWTLSTADGDVIASTGFACLRPSPRIDAAFLGWLAQSDVVVEEVAARSVGVSYPAVNPDAIGTIRVPLLSLTHQRRIADYLDRETARIDALVEKNRRIAGLLHERLESIVYYETHGRPNGTANPDSTNDELPSGWHRRPLRHIGTLQAGAAFPHDQQGATEGTIPYVKVGDLMAADLDGNLAGANNMVTTAVSVALRSPILPPGTVVFPKIGAALLTNKRAVLGQPSCIDQNVMGLTIRIGNPRYYYYYLISVDLGSLSNPGPVPLLNEEQAARVQVPIPPLEQQDDIVVSLDRVTRNVNVMLRAVTRQIMLLQERRQALITALVLGGIDIPEVA